MMYPLLFILKITIRCVSEMVRRFRSLWRKFQHIYQECRNNASLDAGHFLKFDNIKNEIFCKIIGRGRNENCLGEVPYIFLYLDLAVVSLLRRLRMRCFEAEGILIRQEHLDSRGGHQRRTVEYARETIFRERADAMYVYKMPWLSIRASSGRENWILQCQRFRMATRDDDE